MNPIWITVLVAFTLTPMAIRLSKVRRVGRPVHLFDDIVSYLNLPMMVIVLAVPVSPVAMWSIIGVFGVITVVAVYRLGRNVGHARDP